MNVRIYACREQSGMKEYWFEVESTDGDCNVIHTDGMYPDRDKAIEAGEEWARSNGHTIID
jgi:hypothetical protein